MQQEQYEYGQQQQQTEAPTPTNQGMYSSPFYEQGNSITLLTDPSSSLHKLELGFKGLKEDAEGNLIPITDPPSPVMNDLGNNFIITSLISLGNQINVLSNFNTLEVGQLMENFGDSMAFDLMVNHIRYGLDLQKNGRIVFDTCMRFAFGCLKRGYEEGDRKFWKGSIHEIRQVREGMNRKEGILTRLNPFK